MAKYKIDATTLPANTLYIYVTYWSTDMQSKLAMDALYKKNMTLILLLLPYSKYAASTFTLGDVVITAGEKPKCGITNQ